MKTLWLVGFLALLQSGVQPQSEPKPSGSFSGMPPPTGSFSGMPPPTGSFSGEPRPTGSFSGQPRPSGSFSGQPMPTGGSQPQGSLIVNKVEWLPRVISTSEENIKAVVFTFDFDKDVFIARSLADFGRMVRFSEQGNDTRMMLLFRWVV